MPLLPTEKVVGGVTDHPAASASGFVADVVIKYPVTVTSSEAVKEVIGMFKLLEGVVTVNVFTMGGGLFTTTVRGVPKTAETLPAASFAQGYRV